MCGPNFRPNAVSRPSQGHSCLCAVILTFNEIPRLVPAKIFTHKLFCASSLLPVPLYFLETTTTTVRNTTTTTATTAGHDSQ